MPLDDSSTLIAGTGLLHRADVLAQAGFVARSGVLVQPALLDGFIEGGDSLPVSLLGGSLIALGDRFAQIAQLSAQRGGVGAVAYGAAFGLARALLRR